MSYSEVKLFTETMRMIQYPKVISIQSFQEPNFALVSELLQWMTKRYGDRGMDSIEIHNSISTENDRVLFITGIVKGFYQRTKMKLNAKRLYAADGHAVKELLKLATFLLNHQLEVEKQQYHKKNSNNHNDHQGILGSFSSTSYLNYNHNNNINSKNITSLDIVNLDEMKELRKLASEVTEKSAKLYELLQNEIKLHTSHEQEEGLKFLDSVSTGFDDTPELQHIESVLTASLQMKKNEASNLERECRELESDRRDLVEQIKRKSTDLERNAKRLESIEKARPAFMDEYEAMEEELQKHYDLYMERYRNVHYLKREMEKLQREDEETMKSHNSRAKKKVLSQMNDKQHKLIDGGNMKRKHEKESEEEKLFELKSDEDEDEVVPRLDNTDDSAIIINGDEDIANNNILVHDDDDNLSIDDENSLGLLSQRDYVSREGGQSSSSSKKSSSFSVVSESSEDLRSNSSEVGRSNNSISSDEIF